MTNKSNNHKDTVMDVIILKEVNHCRNRHEVANHNNIFEASKTELLWAARRLANHQNLVELCKDLVTAWHNGDDLSEQEAILQIDLYLAKSALPQKGGGL